MILNRQIINWICLFFMIIPLTVSGQMDDCAVNLREAQNQFDQGQIEQVPDLLKGCIESGFTREERIQAYKLVINSYIFDYNLAMAEQYMLEFLRKYPEYEIVATDPSEFVSLFREFNNDPRTSIGILGGTNLSNIRVGLPFAVSGTSDGEYSMSSFGFQAGLMYNVNITPQLEVGIEPMIIQNTYDFYDTPYDFSIVDYTEDQLRIDLPLSFIWRFETSSKIDPYVRLGAKASYLLAANSNPNRSYADDVTIPFGKVIGPWLEIDEKRMNFNYWAVVGTGIRYKIPKAYFFLDIRYNLALRNQVNINSRNDGLDESVWKYYYLQDDIFWDDISFNIGLAKTLYNPKRK